jgi:hypothetical protein
MPIQSNPKIIIGTPVYRLGGYVLDQFLTNLKNIQQNYPDSELIFATCENDYVGDLKRQLQNYSIRGNVISYKVRKPNYSRSNIWNITCGREAIRQYFLRQTNASLLLFLDADIICDPLIISTLNKETERFDLVFSGCPLKDGRVGLAGAGCMTLKRDILERVPFRCLEFKNGQVITEDNLIEMDVFEKGGRIKKGIFVFLEHHISLKEKKIVHPQKVTLFRQLTTSTMFRYPGLKLSIFCRFNVPRALFEISGKISRFKLNQWFM